MPNEAAWETFFDPDATLAALAFLRRCADVIDFGCGYGIFTVAAALQTSGTVYAVDIESSMIEATAARAQGHGLGNVETVLRDFVARGTGLPDESVDYAMLFNILHGENPAGLVAEAFRVLRPGGRVAVTHWVHDAATPRGPDLSIRPRPEDCRQWLEQAGFELLIRHVPLPPHHFGVVAIRPQKEGSQQAR
ncbi:MAG TPA: class I SAM-dependent methyltransferase [Gammaproteobacteria bacterium]|nr:class I SAM-dependent methyltransferase [Gammaproteobacteria bacterium]